MNNAEIYEKVNARILEALEQGTAAWRKPWRPAVPTDPTLHRAFARRNKPYRGVNQFTCWATAVVEGYTSPYWLSKKDIKQRGGSWSGPGTMLVFWKIMRVPSKTEVDKNGRPKIVTVPLLRHYYVWNLDQTTGIAAPEPREEDEHFDPIMEAELVIENMPNAPTLDHGGDRAYYNPARDHVRLPKPEQFRTRESYYLTAFHELGHSTGHESRLNREFGKRFGDDPYAKEELVAEMTAAFVAGVVGLDDDFRPTAAYLRSWMRRIADDPKLLVSAAGQAQKAADCILGVSWASEEESTEIEMVAA